MADSTPGQDVTGKITGGDSHSLVMDDCQAGQSCVVDGIRIDVDAPDLDLTTVPRVWVQVRFGLGGIRGCQQSLEITAAHRPTVRLRRSPRGSCFSPWTTVADPWKGRLTALNAFVGCHLKRVRIASAR